MRRTQIRAYGRPGLGPFAELKQLDLNGVVWQTPETFNDGEALFEAVCAHELEGVVAKRRSSLYRPGAGGWVKIKNRNYWRCEMEHESALNKPRLKQFVWPHAPEVAAAHRAASRRDRLRNRTQHSEIKPPADSTEQVAPSDALL